MIPRTLFAALPLLTAALMGGRHGVPGTKAFSSTLVQGATDSIHAAPLAPGVAAPPVVVEGKIQPGENAVDVPATIHGHAVTLRLDLGSAYNFITAHKTTGLGFDPDGFSFRLDSLTMGRSVRTHLDFGQSPVGGILNQDEIIMGSQFLSDYDMVFDGPARRIRLYARQDGGGKTSATAGSKPATPAWFPAGVTPADCIPIVKDEDGQHRVFFVLQANGHPILGMFDSGAGILHTNIYGAREMGLTLASGHVHPILFPGASVGSMNSIALWEASGVTITVGGRRLAEDSITIFRHEPEEDEHGPVKELNPGLGAFLDRVLYISNSTGQVCFGASSPAVTTHSTTRPDQPAGAGPLLTVDVLTRMTTFWTSFLKEPDSIKTTGRKAHQKKLAFPEENMNVPNVVDIAAMAAQYPSVATDLTQSGLTAQQWEDYRRTIFRALIMQQALANLTQQERSAAVASPASMLMQNVAFLDAHQQEFNTLGKTGMWLPKIFNWREQVGKNGRDDLVP